MGDEERLPDEPTPDEAPTDTAASRGCGVIGCLVIVAVLVALGIGGAAVAGAIDPILDAFRAPDEVVREYVISLEEGNRERALRFLCTELRASVGEGPLPDPVTALEAEGSWRWGGIRDSIPYPRANGRIAIHYEIDQPGTGAARTGEAQLTDEGGWRICSFGE